eukprot:29333-Pelagococcus_subviridis.AAC.8
MDNVAPKMPPRSSSSRVDGMSTSSIAPSNSVGSSSRSPPSSSMSAPSLAPKKPPPIAGLGAGTPPPKNPLRIVARERGGAASDRVDEGGFERADAAIGSRGEKASDV